MKVIWFKANTRIHQVAYLPITQPPIKENPANGRQQISWRVRKVAPIQLQKRCQVSGLRCQVSNFVCHLSPVTYVNNTNSHSHRPFPCHLSLVTCHMSITPTAPAQTLSPGTCHIAHVNNTNSHSTDPSPANSPTMHSRPVREDLSTKNNCKHKSSSKLSGKKSTF